VGCGKSLKDQTIIIVDPDTRIQCPANEVGEIWIAGRSVAQGYWNQPQATQDTFQAHLADTNAGPFLRTGDLGFLHQDELFISGRLQDTIVIRARNHYPQDLEATVEQSHPCLRLGCGAAIAVEMGGEERLVIIQEIERHVQAQLSRQVAPPQGQEEGEVPQPFDVDTIIGNICQAVAEKHDVQVSAVVLLRPGGIPKTSSGKIQRHACRAGFVDQTLDVMAQWKISLLSADAGNEPPPREEEHARRQFTSTHQPPRQQGGHVA
ncbi:MAG: AMP-binding protein, partial [Candidatus Tectomicrobia bacterium]